MPALRLLLVLLLLLVSGAGVATLAWAERTGADQIASGVRVAGVDVGGLTQVQATQRVWSRTRARAMRPVRVRASGRTFTLTARQARVRLRLPATVARAHERGRAGTLLDRAWRKLAGRPIEVDEPLRPTASATAVATFVAGLSDELQRPAIDARLSLSVERVSGPPRARLSQR